MSDFIECKICNKKMKMISNSHLKSHNITPKEYKEKYNISSLTCDDVNKKMSDKAIKSNSSRVGIKRTQAEKDNIKKAINEKIKNGERIYNKTFSDDEFYEYRKLCQRAVNNKNYIPKKYIDCNKKSNIILYDHITDVKNIFIRIDINNNINLNVKNRFILFENKIKNILKNKNKKDYINFKIKRFEEYSNVKITSINSNSFEFECNNCNMTKSFIVDYLNPFHLRKDICDCKKPIIYKKSKAELEILQYIRSLTDFEVKSGDRSVLKNKELDIYIPDMNLAFEYCGLYWHSELSGKDKNYHYDKMINCKNKNIQLITIFEDEYINKKEIVLSRIKNLFNKSSNKIYARKTIVKNISIEECNEFLKQNHLQGVGRSSTKIGLYYNDELVSVMTFQKGDISKNIKDWELNRFCSKLNYNVVGAASKLLSFFKKNNEYKKIISYSDNRWGNGSVYEKMGFKKQNDGIPNYWYFKLNEIKRLHRFTLRKNPKDDIMLTEWENRVKQGYDRIWDCGSSKYEL